MSSSPYQPAATLLNKIWDKDQRASLKSLAFDQNSELTCSKTTYAQVAQVLRHSKTMDAIVQRVKLPTAKNQGLLYVLLYELLMGPNKSIRGGGALKRSLLKQEDALRQALVEIQEEQGSSTSHSNADIEAASRFPRYVRVNTLQTTMKQVVDRIRNLKEGPDAIYADQHVPDLLVLPPGSTSLLKQDTWLQDDSKIVLQDKSSCFSALCLVRGYDSDWKRRWASYGQKVDWIDACAAPGNKTSHLAALVHECLTTESKSSKTRRSSTIYAFDRDPTRHKLLQRRMAKLVPNTAQTVKIQTSCQDFLETKPAEYPHVRGILVDPSCSGSGIFTSLERQRDDDDDSNKRLQHLANFQVKALMHAMNFPSVIHVVYSTCSLDSTENEQVVARVLKDKRKEWELVAPHCLAHWKQRGILNTGSDDELGSQEAASLIRVVHPSEETNGFFVCCFQRIQGETALGSESKSSGASDAANLLDKRAKQLGLELYAGQFAHPSHSANETNNSSNNRKSSVNIAASKEKQEAPSTNDEPLQVKAPNLSKKRAKKREWKDRQRQQKRERLQKKQKT